ncbi:MAG TPA: YaeQ family protein [Bdellovibrionales bacterium]|nr:YaeQ family protein [Bdellovibrionales bacterium]
MALPSTLYRFRIALSDVDRNVYEDLDLRVSMHPSETPPYLLTRVLAYALSYEPGLEFAAGGLSDSDTPAISLAGTRGGLALWIDIGNPTARKLHKAAKAAARVKVFTYKDPAHLVREIRENKVHRADELEIYSFEGPFLEALAESLGRDNRWELLHTAGSLNVTVAGRSIAGESHRHSV